MRLPVWTRTTLKALLLPGGIVLPAVAILAHSGWLTLPLPALTFLYYCALAGGMLLAWRFHSSRIFFALLALFLAQQATSVFGASYAVPGTAGWTALQAAAVLVPFNFVAIALMHERGFTVPGLAPIALFLFVQSVVVAVLCSAAKEPATLASRAQHASPGISFSGYALAALAAASALLLVRTLVTHKPADGALLWSLAAFSLALHFLGTPYLATAYWAAGGFILAASIVETSYLMAYHDELTALPSRRAFNQALLRLQEPYSIAVADIDHFKRFNDTYGHDTGDQVLRLVAARLARVTGGGQAYRCGGEEFTIVFPGKTTAEVIYHLETLRGSVEKAEFRLRGGDRRQVSRGPDRRKEKIHRRTRADAIRQLAHEKSAASLSVTISIGVATSAGKASAPDRVLEAADQALYRAKANGRNRVETESSTRKRPRLRAAGMS
ncbi:MAG TPA: GGDEF domain-containing protein [Candidatus Nitrosotalea sp.]|nr:GGDEF domain-containing protein [Candidatus Nitrosotalea sp.]